MPSARLIRRTFLAGAAMSLAAGMGRPAPPVVRLACPPEAPEPLCSALVQALAEAGPGFVVTREAGALAPGDLAVVLVVESARADALDARLDWQGAGAVTRGAGLGLVAMDSALRPAMLARFAAELVAAAPGLHDALTVR
jgi:hypothetical protein